MSVNGDATRRDMWAGRIGRCLATVIDPCTRMMAGWSLSNRTTADITVSALEPTKSRGYVAGNAISHSDCGAQYTSRTLAEAMTAFFERTEPSAEELPIAA